VKAVVLAGGLGTRLRLVVDDRPKPMALVGGRPFLEHLLLHLQRCGIADFVLCVGYRRETIEDYFGDGASRGMRIVYSVETEPLGTGGALKQAGALLGETFLALNGDSYLAFALPPLLRSHRERAALATLVVTEITDRSAVGTVHFDAGYRIDHFAEKAGEPGEGRGPGESGRCWANAGIYVLEPAVLAVLPAGRPASLEHDLFPELARQGRPIFAYPTAGQFLDIGTPERYFRAQTQLR
jgi:mannose-1-phosphate guanylyltransferase